MGDILNPEEGDQNKSALPRLPPGRLSSTRREWIAVLNEGLFLIFVRFSSRGERERNGGEGDRGVHPPASRKYANRGLEAKSENVG